MEKSVDEANDLMDHMSVHYLDWKSKLKQARMALWTTIPDALLTAGCVVYCGPLGQTLRDGLLSDWLSRCKTANFIFETVNSSSDLQQQSSLRHPLVPNESYSMEEVIGVAEILLALDTSGMLSDNCSRYNTALIYSCLFCRGPLQRQTLLVDPDNQAVSYIRYILEHVSASSHAFSSSKSICLLSVFYMQIVSCHDS